MQLIKDKHYFAGTERILAGVGGGGHPLIETDMKIQPLRMEPTELAERYAEFVRHYFNDISNQTACIKNGIIYEAEINVPPLFKIFKDAISAHSPDKLYYFNANHLGSGSLITDKYGQTYQTLIYAPHGEVLFNRFYGDYDEVYKFNGKELDSETGFYNFNARQQDPIKDIWTSTDPMWYKYPNKSPYVAMGNNSLMFVDKDGKGIFPSVQMLIEAGKSVVSNQKYIPKYLSDGRRATYCNFGAQAINSMAGDNSVKGRANDMGAYLRNTDNATSISQEQANNYANQGVVIFASYVSDGKSEPGHIAVVAPTENLTYSPSRNEDVVNVYNVGANNGEMTLTQAFGIRDVGLFILNTDLTTINEQTPMYNGGTLPEVVVTGKSGISQPKLPLLKIDDQTDVKDIKLNLNIR